MRIVLQHGILDEVVVNLAKCLDLPQLRLQLIPLKAELVNLHIRLLILQRLTIFLILSAELLAEVLDELLVANDDLPLADEAVTSIL